MQSAKNIDFYILVENKHTQIELNNVNFLLKFNVNLILFEFFKEKECKFRTINSLLKIKNKRNDIVVKFFRKNGIFLLW